MFEKEKKLNLLDLIDIKFLQEFQDVFSKTTNIASLTVDDNGPITEPSNFSDFCIMHARGSELGFKRCNECDIHYGKVAAQKAEPVIYTCPFGLTDFAVPIIVDGQHLGSILGGQILTEQPNEEYFKEIAREFGINEEKYIDALKKIKIMSLEEVKTAADLLYFLASTVSQLSNQNLELIKKNEKYTKTILDSIKDGIVIITNDYIIKSCNPSVETIWGYSLSEVIGKPLNLLVNHDCLNKNVKICLSNSELFGKSKNGETFPVEIDVSEVDFEDNITTLLVIRDITERKKVEKMKNEFVSTVSHELRTPLTSIKGSLGLIVSGVLGPIPEKMKNLIDIANNNCTRLTNLINDILDLEKIKAGKYDFKYEDIEINSIIEQSVILNQSYAEQFGMRVKAVKLADDTFIKADKNRILQVISNLLSNAVKFSNLGGEVTVVLEIIGEKVKVSFIDKGIGIPEDAKYKIFQSFSQVDSSDTRSKGGTGLGLSICKLLIEKMGGLIGFDSTAGQGSTFFFIMPIVQPELVKCDGDELKELCLEEDF